MKPKEKRRQKSPQNENKRNRIKELLNENGMEYAEDSLELIYSPDINEESESAE